MAAGSGAIAEATCSFNLAAVAMHLNNRGVQSRELSSFVLAAWSKVSFQDGLWCIPCQSPYQFH